MNVNVIISIVSLLVVVIFLFGLWRILKNKHQKKLDITTEISSLPTKTKYLTDSKVTFESPVADSANELPKTESQTNNFNVVHNSFGKKLLNIIKTEKLTAASWETIEEILLTSDVGSSISMEIIESLKQKITDSTALTSVEIKDYLKDILVEKLLPNLDRNIHAISDTDKPAVILIVGVNGSGKTTTTAKLAQELINQNKKVILGAADTFRAAAIEQLKTWGNKVGVPVVSKNSDPAAVAYDAISEGIAQKADTVIIDTAGRLHTKTDLMNELNKIERVIKKQADINEALLVLDATMGQNGLLQAKVFGETINLTGVVLTKLDGTAKGGIVFQIQEQLNLPIKLVGLGEGEKDLAPFDPVAFVSALIGD